MSVIVILLGHDNQESGEAAIAATLYFIAHSICSSKHTQIEGMAC